MGFTVTGRLILLLLLLSAAMARAQDLSVDTTRTAPTDTSQVADTAAVNTLAPLPGDSLSPAERARLEFEKRRQQYQEEQEAKERVPGFSFYDTLITYFTSPRQNIRPDVDRSWYHDASDYFRFNPSHLALTEQSTPMRSTVRPFGLTGDRLNFITYGYELQPYGNVPEPEGLTEMNAIPTALDQDIFLLPGPVGQLFGGESSVASLVTRPLRPDDKDFHTSLLADQGGFEYYFVRGRMVKRFTDGRSIDAAIEYRNADGENFGRRSDQYIYYGDFFFPLSASSGLRTWGYLFDLSGPLAIRPDLGGGNINRDQFNRQAQVSFVNDASDGSRRFEAGYRHGRHGSYNTSSGGGLSNRLNWTSHGAFASRNWMAGGKALSLDAEGEYLEYDTGPGNFDRICGRGRLRLADLSTGWRWALSLGGEYADDFEFLPAGSLTLFREGRGGLFLLSLGYTGRAPGMTELHLPEESAPLYPSSEGYAESGNPDLDAEAELIGSITVELGSVRNNLNISATGGRIIDAVEWQPVQNGSTLRFSPINTDLDFATVAAMPSIGLGHFLAFRGGASYHWIEFAEFESSAYTPEYQVFTGLELHVYWPQRGLDLFAYGELVYTGEYDGYRAQGLGQEFAPNGKLSFGMGDDFRMHFVFQNALSVEYSRREYFTTPGRFFYFGFEWKFLN